MELAAGATAKAPIAALVLLDGLLSAGIGLLLVLEWPSDSVWALGTLFGITLFLSALIQSQKDGILQCRMVQRRAFAL